MSGVHPVADCVLTLGDVWFPLYHDCVYFGWHSVMSGIRTIMVVCWHSPMYSLHHDIVFRLRNVTSCILSSWLFVYTQWCLAMHSLRIVCKHRCKLSTLSGIQDDTFGPILLTLPGVYVAFQLEDACCPDGYYTYVWWWQYLSISGPIVPFNRIHTAPDKQLQIAVFIQLSTLKFTIFVSSFRTPVSPQKPRKKLKYVYVYVVIFIYSRPWSKKIEED